MNIAENLERVRARIAAAEKRAGRAHGSVTLVAVSKMQPASAIEEAYAAGQRIFGENYVQELAQKASGISHPDLVFHFIGHLQRNKVKDVLAAANAIETVDSLRLAEELSRRLGERTLPIFLQVNIANEPQKSGCSAIEAPSLVREIRAMKNLELRGLMTVPPASENAEDARPHFRALRELAKSLDVPELSMGMSADMDVAIEEGATHVRVGTSIFGSRY